ncbi:MAG: penicillin-binding protein activator [Thioalkalispiraceae bacterium]|jgi:outer membrane PBP1 activator LpoA protein
MTRRFSILFIFIFIFSGCTTTPPTEMTVGVSGEDPELLFQAGQFENAANGFIAQAKEATGAQQNFYRLRASAALARSGKLPEARQWLSQVKSDTLDSFTQTIYKLTLAHIAIAERKTEEVQRLLSEPIDPAMSAIYVAEYHKLRAESFKLAGNQLEAARELVKRENFLSDNQLVLANQQEIWSVLASMSERALQQLRTAPPPDVLSGWMELVQISKLYQLSPARLKEQIYLWKEEYPGHPASEEILTALSQRKEEDVAYPDRVALMLPLSGKFARAGEALRDGFLAAYYTLHPNLSQSIKIYDVGSNPDVSNVYQQAVSEGAQFVVGPLTKDAVTHISEIDELPVPVLALNYTLDEEAARSNFYQFGLSPEEEARQVAERTWLDGHVNAAVLTPIGPWGERIYQAFKERWELMGGKIVERQSYEPTKTDFSRPIRSLLNIDDSTRRYRRIATTLKRDIKFTSRRRQDIDFVFIAAYPRQARQIRPQLKFYHASDVPVYATSHVYTGILNPERDRDMDGLMFGDMPWVLSESTMHRGIRSEIERQISDAGNALQRLYALGIDSFNIIGALNTLRKYPYERFDGETGSLSLDTKLRVRRQLTWVKFRSGRPVLINQGNL